MAEAFVQVWLRRRMPRGALGALHGEACGARIRERTSCVLVQRLWRGQRIRTWALALRCAGIAVARIYRGHRGRAAHAACAAARTAHEAVAIFHYHAVLGQRTFRGYYSRRYRHDFRARKRYVLSVVATGAALRKALDAQRRERADAEARDATTSREAAFARVVRHLHHLVSTRSIPGVYAAPHEQEPPAMVCGAPVEAHLRAGVRDLLRLADYAKPRLECDLRGTRRIALGPLPDPRSLQAAAPYDAPRDARRLEARLGRVGFVGAADLRAGQRVRQEPYRRGVNDGSAFHDPWKNPYLRRGIPRAPADLEHSASTLGRAPAGPTFYTRAGGNMSVVHANGIFDIIRAAERTGGVTGRRVATHAGFIDARGQDTQ